MKRRDKQYKRRMFIRHICPNWVWVAWVLDEPFFTALKAEIKGRRFEK